MIFVRAMPGNAATLPTGFAETKIAEGLNPTTMSFAPDGRLFLCEKQGLLRVVVDGVLLPGAVLDLTDKVDGWNERGLLSVCFDPDFPRNGWIYAYYTLNGDPRDKRHESSHNRVSRFTLKGNVADPKSEKVLLEMNPLTKTGWHNGGGLAFGKDGKLYIGTGENNNGPHAQSHENLLGKLLRINKDGTIPQDNPHYRDYKGDNRAIVALGLRNAFALAVQPETGLLYLSMVGANYEEIDRYDTASPPVALNYGWPGIDGPRKNQDPPEGYQDPAHAYDHGRGEGTALCAGNFYTPSKPGAGAFPPEYRGRFFFADYRGWIKSIDPANPETPQGFATKINRPLDVDIAPDGTLWYIERAGISGGSDEANSASENGSLWRVRWTGGGQPVKLAVTGQPVDAKAGGPIGTVTVALQDESGNTVSAASDTITLTLEGGGAGAVLGGTTKATAVKGVATFSALSIMKPGGNYTLRANSGGLEVAESKTFKIEDELIAPVITPPGGGFTGPVWVRLFSPVPGAAIHFTTDGKDPDASSPVYRAPFQIDGAQQTVKAIARGKGAGDSAVAAARIEVSGDKPYGIDTRPPVSGLKFPATEAEGLPQTLSATGIFSDGNLTPKPGVLPYSLNAPAWADGAETRRWVILPEGSKVGFHATGEYTWPGGTVFVQHFDLRMDGPAKPPRKLETRVLVLDASGSSGYGASYRWRTDQRDADLVDAGGMDEVLKVTDAKGSAREQSWNYPARALCFMCHTANAGFVLGPKTRQLNGVHEYAGGRSDHQLRTWSYLQMFREDLKEGSIPDLARSCRIDDDSAKLEDRVRSYLDANCAHCHRPGGTGALWDGRYETPLAQQGIANGELRDTMGIAGAKLVVPGDPARSMMIERMGSTTFGRQMPPVSRNVVDAEAVELIRKWVEEMGK
jgi:uncharacterized repeat protein (TIGR03806 family)